MSGRPPRHGSMVQPPGRDGSSGQAGAPPPRRWSVLEQSPVRMDHQRGSSTFVRAWGAPSEKEPAEQQTASSSVPVRGFVEGHHGGGGGLGQGDKMPLGRPLRSTGAAASPGTEGPGGSAPQTRCWSVPEHAPALPLDQSGPSPAISYAPAWGAPIEEGSAGGSPARQDRDASGNPGMGSARRGSVVAAPGRQRAPGDQSAAGTMGPPVGRRGSVVAAGLATGACEESTPAGVRAGQGRRGSVVGVAAGAMPSPEAQRRRASVVGGGGGGGGGALASPGKEHAGVREGAERQQRR